MTAAEHHHQPPLFANWLAQAGRVARNVWTFTVRLLFGALIIIAAGVVALATAIAGLLLAAAALVVRAITPRPKRSRPATATIGDGDGMVLEARRTSRGWRVE